MMKGKDIKWLVGMIPDDAFVTINRNYLVEVSALDCEGHDGVYNLQLTPGYSITEDDVLDGMMAQLRSLCDRIAEGKR